MRVDLSEDVLIGIPDRSLDTLGIVALADRMGHVIGTTLVAAAEWTKGLGEPLAHAIAVLLDTHRERLPGLSAETLRVMVHAGDTDWRSGRLSLDDAWLMLCTPLELLVENERSDWEFIRRLAPQVLRGQLDAAVARGALRPRQGGGITELKKSVDALFMSVGHSGLDRQRRIRRLRTWVLFDRDASPEDLTQPGAHADETVASCMQVMEDDPWPLAWKRLGRRHIESYLPDEALRHWARGKGSAADARVDALMKLRRDHPTASACLNLKGGLAKDLAKNVKNTLRERHQNAETGVRREAEAEIPVECWIAPFDRVPSELRADLLEGFGPVAYLFVSTPEALDPLFADEFDRDDGPGAARDLVNSIIERL